MYSRSPFRAHRCCSPGPGAAAYCDQIVRRREPAVSFVNIEQAEFWSQVAPTWLEQEEQLEMAAGLPRPPAMASVELLPRPPALGLGCRSGPTAGELASAGGVSGWVVGLGIAAEMLT